MQEWRRKALVLGLPGRYACRLIMTGNKADAVHAETLGDFRARVAWLGVLQGSTTSSVLILAFLVAASYFPAVWAGFVWDDEIIRRIDSIRGWSGIWDLWFSPSAVYHESGSGAGAKLQGTGT